MQQRLSKPTTVVVLAVILGLWLFARGLPEFAGILRILFNLVVATAAIVAMVEVWRRSDWNPNG